MALRYGAMVQRGRVASESASNGSRFSQPGGSRQTDLSLVLERSSQSDEVQLTVGVEQACRSVICARSADHVQPRIGSPHGGILIRQKKDLIGRPDRPGAPGNRVMRAHMDCALAPLFGIVVLGAKSSGAVTQQRAFPVGRRLATQLELR